MSNFISVNQIHIKHKSNETKERFDDKQDINRHHGVHTLIPHQRYGNLKAFAFQI